MTDYYPTNYQRANISPLRGYEASGNLFSIIITALRAFLIYSPAKYQRAKSFSAGRSVRRADEIHDRASPAETERTDGKTKPDRTHNALKSKFLILKQMMKKLIAGLPAPFCFFQIRACDTADSVLNTAYEKNQSEKS